MKKLKTILKYSICVILIITFIYQYKKPITSKYDKNTSVIYGIITSCENKKDKTTLIIKGKENILINYTNNYKCTLGKTVKIYGTLIEPSQNSVFYLFNYKKYLLSKKIYHIVKANKIESINKKIKTKYKIKNHIIKHINQYKSKAYLKTFLLANNSNIESNIKESYQKNGISHLFAISGMHLLLISSIITNILKKITQNNNLSNILTIYILIIYLFITGYPISLIRALISYIILNINKIFKIKINKIYIYTIILLALLNINPYYIYDLGFLLTFTITMYLIIFKDLITSHSYLTKTIKMSIIAFISSMPYIINNNFELNFLSIILNILFIPIISYIVYPLAILTSFIKPLDNTFYIIINIFENISLKINKINFLTFTFCHIEMPITILYFIIITTTLFIKKKKGKNIYWLIILILIIHHNINLFNHDTTITTIDVGQGDSILIKFKHNKGNILIDTGGIADNENYSITKSKTIPYLNAEGIYKIKYLIITHGDYDHMGEAINLVENFKVEKVIFNCGEFNELEQGLIKVLDQKKIPYYSCIKELNIDNNKLYFLQTKEYDNENDNSNVIYTRINDYKFMFMGDAGADKEKDILDKYNISDIDVLKVGHHGSKTSSSESFINEINPKYSIISIGKNNRYGHPNKEVLNILEDTKIYRTDQDGSIMFKIKNNKLKIETCTP